MQESWNPARRRCFFVHIPKTAGMTMRSLLRSQYAAERVMPAASVDALAALPRPVEDYDLYAGHFRYPFAERLSADVFSFTFLRDPALRMLSHVQHVATDPAFDDLHAYAKGRDLRSLLEDDVIVARCSNVQTGYLAGGSTDGRPVDEDDAASALENLRRLAFVGFVEDYDADAARLFAALGLHPRPHVPKLNAAAVRQGGTSFDAEAIEMARALNPLDGALYDAAKAGSRREPPLSPDDAIAKLVADGVYRPISVPTEFPIGGPLPVTDLWEQEPNGASFFRWTGPAPTISIAVPIAAGHGFTLEAQIFLPEPVGTLTVVSNGGDAAVEVIDHDERAKTIRVAVANDGSRPISTVTISAETTRVAGSDDPRRVGYILNGLRLG